MRPPRRYDTFSSRGAAASPNTAAATVWLRAASKSHSSPTRFTRAAQRLRRYINCRARLARRLSSRGGGRGFRKEPPPRPAWPPPLSLLQREGPQHQFPAGKSPPRCSAAGAEPITPLRFATPRECLREFRRGRRLRQEVTIMI